MYKVWIQSGNPSEGGVTEVTTPADKVQFREKAPLFGVVEFWRADVEALLVVPFSRLIYYKATVPESTAEDSDAQA